MKTLCFVAILIAVTVAAYNGPSDADAAQYAHAVKVERLEHPVHAKLDRNVDVLSWDGSKTSTRGAMAKGSTVTIVGTAGGNAVLVGEHGTHQAYLVAIDQLPEQVRSLIVKSGDHGKPCPLDPQKRICEVKR